MLLSHLAGFERSGSDQVRFRVNALASPTSLVLCVPPVLMVPPPNRQRLATTGYRLVDRLAIDVADDGTTCIVDQPWSSTAQRPTGHFTPDGQRRPVSAIVVHSSVGQISRARATAALCATALTARPSDVLRLAVELVEAASVIGLPQQQIDELPIRLGS